MDLGYLQRAAIEIDRQREEYQDFDFGVLSTYRLWPFTGKIEHKSSCTHTHIKFKPTWKDKVRLILMILRA